MTKKHITKAVKVAFTLAIVFFLTQLKMESFESLSYDLRTRWSPNPYISGHVQTIAIDNQTISELQRSPSLQDHAMMLERLAEARPKAIVYFINPETLSNDDNELLAFSQLVQKLPFYYAVQDQFPEPNRESKLQLYPPLNQIEVVSAPKTADKNTFARDGVTRRLILTFQGQDLFHNTLAKKFNKLENKDYRGVFTFKRTEQAFINYREPGTYPRLSFSELINDNPDLKQFRDKIVLVGLDTRSAIKNYSMTPYSRDVDSMSNLEVHANILDTLIMNQAPVKFSEISNLLITATIALLTLMVVFSLHPLNGILALGILVIGYSLITYIALAFFGLWLPMAHPLIAVFICYYFFIPYRLIIENRRSWEYYHKNKLLTQVEELKSNFLRLMSHDLKTPLARIQGMSDMILREKQNLSKQQIKALDTITESNEELTEFIGSILNLGRIESKEIKLHLKSKDINTLITEVIKRYEYMATRKNIRIVTEFEPMFSMKMDEDLIRQVISNLIENAIKYSSKNSSILVSTEESGGQVNVQVADQGIGIPSNEMDNIFDKFYRSKKVTNSPIKGSGLGLYLAQYFVSLHKGQISVESEYRNGSTFTVELPMSLES